jgi:Mg/Co/Ni transporter MgtE
MESNTKIKNAIIEVVNIQIESNDPPETKQTFDRLVSEGFSIEEAKKLIGSVVVAEVFDVMTAERNFDIINYVAALNDLPKKPEIDRNEL